MGGNGTTAGCVAPDRNGLVRNGRAPQPGTARNATTELGSDPNPATPTGCGDEQAESPHPRPGRAGEAVRPEPGTARPTRAVLPYAPPAAFRGTPEFIHTLEIDVIAVPERSNNRGVDLDCVDGCRRAAASVVIIDWARNPSSSVGFRTKSTIMAYSRVALTRWVAVGSVRYR